MCYSNEYVRRGVRLLGNLSPDLAALNAIYFSASSS